MSAAMSRRIRAAFGAVNFWAIVLYNILALNSLEFAQLVTKRLLLAGEVPLAFPFKGSSSYWGDTGRGAEVWSFQVLSSPTWYGH